MTQNPLFEMYKDPINLVIIPKEVVTVLEIKKISCGSAQVEMYLKNEVARELEFFLKLIQKEGFKQNGKSYVKMNSIGLEEHIDNVIEYNKRDLFVVSERIFEIAGIGVLKPIEVQIREARLQRHLPLGKTAGLVGITTAQLSNIESGRCKPGWKTAEKLAKLLHTKFII